MLLGQRMAAQIANDPTFAPMSKIVSFSPKYPDSYSPFRTAATGPTIGSGHSKATGTRERTTRFWQITWGSIAETAEADSGEPGFTSPAPGSVAWAASSMALS